MLLVMLATTMRDEAVRRQESYLVLGEERTVFFTSPQSVHDCVENAGELISPFTKL
jgi:hypothetical protein